MMKRHELSNGPTLSQLLQINDLCLQWNKTFGVLHIPCIVSDDDDIIIDREIPREFFSLILHAPAMAQALSDIVDLLLNENDNKIQAIYLARDTLSRIINKT